MSDMTAEPTQLLRIGAGVTSTTPSRRALPLPSGAFWLRTTLVLMLATAIALR